eukprot:2603633-Rhodomonas_salina.4
MPQRKPGTGRKLPARRAFSLGNSHAGFWAWYTHILHQYRVGDSGALSQYQAQHRATGGVLPEVPGAWYRHKAVVRTGHLLQRAEVDSGVHRVEERDQHLDHANTIPHCLSGLRKEGGEELEEKGGRWERRSKQARRKEREGSEGGGSAQAGRMETKGERGREGA